MKPTIYGVTCRWEHNPRRSNFGGKSAFLEGLFKFALYGKHRKRTEDEWITKGEKEGGVKTILRDGNLLITIDRKRRLGSSTKLQVRTKSPDLNNEVVYEGDEAQAFIERAIGLGWEDFENSSFFTQKKMSRFITEDSGERMNIVTRWFRLGQLETAIDSVGEQLSKVLKEVTVLEQERSNCTNEMARVLDMYGMEQVAGMMVADVSSTLAKLDEKLVELKAKAEQAAKNELLFEEKRDSLSTNKYLFDQAREYDETVTQGKALRKRVTAYLDQVPTEAHLASQKTLLRAITEDLGAAQREVATKAKLARGEFDGKCPVAGIDCPIRNEINGETKKNAQLLAAATTEHNALASRRKKLAEEVESEEKLLRQYEEDTEERGRLLEKVKKLEPAFTKATSLQGMVDYGTSLESTKVSLREAKDQAAVCMKETAVIETTKKLLVQLEVASARADKELEGKCASRDLLLDARRVLTEAVREIARVNLQAIEVGANYALMTCGIDLTVAASWERPTKSPEKNCSACGWAFPASRKVKVCEMCGAPRGVHMERKLEVQPSDESGGADDLGGIALQLAAADWLRRDRGAAWAVAELDEPFGALDAQHSADLASHLAMLLKYFGFEQAFVVAHSAGIMASMPDVVEIVAGPKGSMLVERIDERTSGKVVDGDGRDAEGNRTAQPRKGARSKDSDVGGAVRSKPSDRKNHGDEGRSKTDSGRAGRRTDSKAPGVAKPRKGAAAKGSRRPTRGTGR